MKTKTVDYDRNVEIKKGTTSTSVLVKDERIIGVRSAEFKQLLGKLWTSLPDLGFEITGGYRVVESVPEPEPDVSLATYVAYMK